MIRNNNYTKEKSTNSTQLRAQDQINFLLKRFNFTSQQFTEEINYLLEQGDKPTFDLGQFISKLLVKCQRLLILESWTSEPHYFTLNYQVLGAQRLLKILDLNEFLELNAKFRNLTYDSDPYSLTRQSSTRSLQRLVVQARYPLQVLRSVRREPAPPVRASFSPFGGDFYPLSH